MPIFIRLCLLLSALLLAPTPATAAFDHGGWDALVQRHVALSADGSQSTVDYAAVAADPRPLRAYLDQLSAVTQPQFDRWSKDEQLAFLINAYNAWTVELIVRNWPGVTSIQRLGTPFTSPWQSRFIPLLGARLSLDDIEHGRIRAPGQYDDPRIHFAVNCASIGCPALANRAYRGATLDAQLDAATRAFLSDRSRNRPVAGGIALSPLFSWYAGDFERPWRGETGVAAFAARYGDALSLPPSERAALRAGQRAIRYTDYDWRLNDRIVPRQPAPGGVPNIIWLVRARPWIGGALAAIIALLGAVAWGGWRWWSPRA